ncbi:MAG: CHC2 zinc finger domain-containing protein [Bacillota bacterium]
MSISPNLFRELKDKISLADFFSKYGIDVNRRGDRIELCCIFHQERTPSMKSFRDKMHCFGCGFSGDIIDLTAKYFGLSPLKSARKLADDFGVGSNVVKRTNRSIREIDERVDLLQKAFNSWRNKWQETLCQYARCIGNVVVAGLHMDMDNGHWWLDREPVIHELLDILQFGTDEDQLKLWLSRSLEEMFNG